MDVEVVGVIKFSTNIVFKEGVPGVGYRIITIGICQSLSIVSVLLRRPVR